MKMLGLTPETPESKSISRISRNNPMRSGISRRRLVKSSRGSGGGGSHGGPRLETIKMVATAIKEAKEYPSKYQLWRSLSKGMAYAKLEQILNYLESTNQIMIDKNDGGRIVWILAEDNNPKLKQLLTESTRLR